MRQPALERCQASLGANRHVFERPKQHETFGRRFAQTLHSDVGQWHERKVTASETRQ